MVPSTPPDVQESQASARKPTRGERNVTRPLTEDDETYKQWQSSLRIGVEHAIGRIKKLKIFADIDCGSGLQNMIAKNVAAWANINLKVA